MNSSISHRSHRVSWGRRASQLCVASLGLVLLLVFVGVGAAGASEEEATDIWDALIHGKPTLNFRARVEIANQDTKNQSEAYTFRTRLGYGTKPFKGVSIYGDFENIAAIEQKQYFNGLGSNPRNLTTVADPTLTEVNQIYMKVHNKELLDSTVIGGRQRII